jgi:hypothetical protein
MLDSKHPQDEDEGSIDGADGIVTVDTVHHHYADVTVRQQILSCVILLEYTVEW